MCRPRSGLTTGTWIVADLAERIAMIREWEGVDCAMVNLSEQGFEQVMAAMLDVGTGVDVGLWAPVEMNQLIQSGLPDGTVAPSNAQLVQAALVLQQEITS